MSITLTKVYGAYDMPSRGTVKKSLCTIAFDSSYPWGGEAIDTEAKNKLGFSNIHGIFCEQNKGYTFEYDKTNGKLKSFTQAPAIVYEEKHTAAANSVTLDYPAAWIINVCTTGQNEALTGRGDTLVDNECKLTSAITDGVRTGITTFGATDAIMVTYVTQAWAEVYKLLVQEESVTLATGNNNLANPMAAFGYCYAATTGLLLPVDTADTAAAGEVAIKFNAATAQLNINVAQNGEVAKVTYLKTPAAASWLADRWIYDEDPAKAGVDPYTQAFDYPLLMWGITGCLTVNTGATLRVVDQGITVATGEINTRWGVSNYELLATVGAAPAAGHVWGAKDNVTVTAGNYIPGLPWEIPGLVQLEAKDTSDLSSLTAVRAEIWGTV